MSRRDSRPARCSGPENATIDAFEMTVLSRSKNAAARRSPSAPSTVRGYRPLLPGRCWSTVDEPATRGILPRPDLPRSLIAARFRGCSSEVPMLFACWSSKGGAGTTVVAAALAVLLAERCPAGALIADLAGDVPAALGVAEADGPGLAGWLG